MITEVSSLLISSFIYLLVSLDDLSLTNSKPDIFGPYGPVKLLRLVVIKLLSLLRTTLFMPKRPRVFLVIFELKELLL